jgi:hypothetical protein
MCWSVCFFYGLSWSHFSGYVSSQNRMWSAESLHALHGNSVHLSRIGIWCLVSQKQIVGSLFFEERITAGSSLTQFIAVLAENERDCWFQIDGQPPIAGRQQLSRRTWLLATTIPRPYAT